MARLARENRLHYANLTEYVKGPTRSTEIARGADHGFLLQTGLAPGYINVLGNGLFQRFCRGARRREGGRPSTCASAPSPRRPGRPTTTASPGTPRASPRSTSSPPSSSATSETATRPSLTDRKIILIDGIALRRGADLRRRRRPPDPVRRQGAQPRLQDLPLPRPLRVGPGPGRPDPRRGRCPSRSSPTVSSSACGRWCPSWTTTRGGSMPRSKAAIRRGILHRLESSRRHPPPQGRRPSASKRSRPPPPPGSPSRRGCSCRDRPQGRLPAEPDRSGTSSWTVPSSPPSTAETRLTSASVPPFFAPARRKPDGRPCFSVEISIGSACRLLSNSGTLAGDFFQTFDFKRLTRIAQKSVQRGSSADSTRSFRGETRVFPQGFPQRLWRSGTAQGMTMDCSRGERRGALHTPRKASLAEVG